MSTEDKRSAALQAIAGYLLAEGLEETGIRKLAAAAGISDRMLIYYFGNKDTLLERALSAISVQTAEGLQLLGGEGRLPRKDILGLLDAALDIPDFENAMLLFLEVAARGARGIEPFRSSAKATIAFWLAWLDERLDMSNGQQSPHDLLVEIEGRILLQLIDRS